MDAELAAPQLLPCRLVLAQISRSYRGSCLGNEGPYRLAGTRASPPLATGALFTMGHVAALAWLLLVILLSPVVSLMRLVRDVHDTAVTSALFAGAWALLDLVGWP